jgi:hypothetical protein
MDALMRLLPNIPPHVGDWKSPDSHGLSRTEIVCPDAVIVCFWPLADGLHTTVIDPLQTLVDDTPRLTSGDSECDMRRQQLL